MKIPYGISDFARIRERGFFYADKTTFLPELENLHTYAVFLRPRRFGKSTLVSMLSYYYDLTKEDRFDALFKGLWVHGNPTYDRSRYLILTLDFSRMSAEVGTDGIKKAFIEAVKGSVRAFIIKHRALIPPLDELEHDMGRDVEAEVLLNGIFSVVSTTDYRVYVLIDEYDHFANRLLAGGAENTYEAIVTKTGFVRTFYATLKSWTSAGAVGRMFVTGVSPLMLDDLSSGFNIASHASMDVGLAAFAGFTRAETERAVDEFLGARPDLTEIPVLSDREALLSVLSEFYNGYRFSQDAEERVFNSDMVLYFLSQLDRTRKYPKNMLDRNVRTQYSHLQRIGTLSGTAATDRRTLLQKILTEGHIRTDIVEQFGVKSLKSSAPFLSLLYYLGMLTLSSEPEDVFGYDLEIPNRVIRELQWEHLAVMLNEQTGVDIDLSELHIALGKMATAGEIQPFLDLFHQQVLLAFSNRDMRGLDEKTIKLLLMTYASLGKVFYPLSEKEFAQGYTDLFLGASEHVMGARYSWLLELKYLKTDATTAQEETAFDEARAQVSRYLSDRTLLPLLLRGRELKAGMLVFVGAKKVLFQPFA